MIKVIILPRLGMIYALSLDFVQTTLGLLKTNFAIAENDSPYTPHCGMLYCNGLFNSSLSSSFSSIKAILSYCHVEITNRSNYIFKLHCEVTNKFYCRVF